MASLDGGIIANSAFSWWGAYIQGHSRKGTIIAPRVWLRNGADQSDYRYPKEWLII
jgi:hypothetical protein